MAEKHALIQFGTQNDLQAQNQWYSDNTGDPKRRKIEQQMSKASVDPHNAPVSRVVHARAVPDGCSFQMLIDSLQRFGKISYLTMMPKLRQALVEFERLEDAINCVRTAADDQLYLMDRHVFFNFSTSQEITRSPYGYAPDSNQAPPDEPPPNHILLYTIFKPMYSINVDVIHTISSPYGVVQRIAIFKKNGIQALVEFDSNVSANRAKQNLDGADIYAGCCTLKIEYARTQKVNVNKNDDMTYDISLQGQRMGGMRPQPMPQAAMNYQPHYQQGYQQGYRESYGQPQGPPQYGGPHGPPGGIPGVPVPAMNPGPSPAIPGSVVMVYGLDKNVNCDGLFNLFCSYGNVLKVKILVNKKGTAMVHLDNPTAVKNAIQFLSKCVLFGTELELALSKHDFIADHGQTVELLPDGSPCWKDFSQSRNNRFLTVEGTSKNRIIGPTKILHFYNAPPDATDETINTIFSESSAPLPVTIKFISQGGKSSTGLLEWGTIETALDAFVLVNHKTLHVTDGRAFTFKLAFSPTPNLDKV